MSGDEKTHHAKDFTCSSSLFNMKPTTHPGTQETASKERKPLRDRGALNKTQQARGDV